MSRRLRNLPYISLGLVAINVIVYIVCIFTERLYFYGGLSRVPIVQYGQYGRLFWSLFLHADVSHLFNNMIILFFLGSMLEKEVGHVAYGSIYFLSGLGGSLCSLYYKIVQHSNTMSIGASGAVFGLDGLLLAIVLLSPKSRGMIPPQRIAIVVILSLYDGFIRSNVDNAGHLGGFAVGFVAGLILCLIQIAKERKNSAR